MPVPLGLNEVTGCVLALLVTAEVYVNLRIVELDGTENVAYDDKEVMPVGVDVLLFVSVTSGRGVRRGDRYAWVRDPVAEVISTIVVDT